MTDFLNYILKSSFNLSIYLQSNLFPYFPNKILNEVSHVMAE